MILLMGLPGSGKGTQGKMMADTRGYHLISMGELVRMYVTGERRQKMLAGELLDDEEIISIVDKVLSSIPDDEECVLDGFPRTVRQAEWLLGGVKAGRFKINHIFHLAASEEAVKARLKARGRLDDQDSVIEERFREYNRLTRPVLTWLQQAGLTVTEINAERSASEVNDDVVRQLRSSR